MNERILVVDDDHHLLSAFRRQLGERFDITTMQTGKDAIAAVRVSLDKHLPFAVVLCDMRMPGIGHVAIPPDLVAKKRRHELLNETEELILERTPEIARDLLANIPRLSKVGEIVLLQDRGYDGSGFPADGPKGDAIPLDARFLKILKDLAAATDGGPLTSLDLQKQQYDPVLLAKVRTCLRALVSGRHRRSSNSPWRHCAVDIC